jgi:uncharacterized sulfatase
MDEEQKRGAVNDQTILAGMDLPPSLLSVAGVNKPPEIKFDGLDMSSVLLGESEQKRNEPIMWVRPPGTNEANPDLAIREGRWKLLVDKDGRYEKLYNLKENPLESNNMADQLPDTTAKLRKKVLDWYNSLH